MATVSESNESTQVKSQVKGVIVLYGFSNSGKTSTLRQLIKQLNPLGRNPQTNLQDIKAIVEYRNRYIYFSTMGDTSDCVLNSINFFEGKHTSTRAKIWLIKSGDSPADVLKDNQYLKHYPPTIFVTASHPKGYTAALLNGYCESQLPDVSANMWIHKEKCHDEKDYNSSNQHMRDLLHQLIDIILDKL